MDFSKIQGPYTSENIAGVAIDLLEELDISTKLLTLISDNASNNDALVDNILHGLQERYPTTSLRFDGPNSYIRCIAHILNLVVKDILATLKVGDCESASTACNLLAKRKSIGNDHSYISRLRILSL